MGEEREWRERERGKTGERERGGEGERIQFIASGYKNP